MTQPLQGLRVVELAQGIAGPYAGKLFADFGADVVKIEPPSGDVARAWGPFPDDHVDELEHSATFLHCNTNKRSVVLDVTVPADRDTIVRLAAGADLVIESSTPGAADDLVEAIRAANPATVVLSVAPFGRTGPYAGLPADELTMYAMGGTLNSTGLEDREPIKLGANIGLYQCGNVAAMAALAAVTSAASSGVGIHIDLSNLETQAGSIDRRMTYLLYKAYTGRDAPRLGGVNVGPLPLGVFPTADGYVYLACMPAWIPRMLATVGDAELAQRYANPAFMADTELPEYVDGVMYGWTLPRTRQQAMEEAQANGWAVTALNAPVDVLDDPHFTERGFFVEVDHPVAGRFRQPGAPIRLDDGWALRRPAPLLGQHTTEVLAELPADAPPVDARPPRSGPGAAAAPAVVGTRKLPLEGIRVLDLTVVWAGPYAAMFLADLGAEVIRIDNPWVFPSATRGLMPRPPRELAEQLGPIFGGYPDTDPGPRPWNRIALFTAHARNKRSITLDLRKELGRETFLRLVEQADVILENNAVGLWDKLGLGWDVIHDRNPATIMVRMPSSGLWGPYKDYIGFGIHFETLVGLTALRGYADRDPSSNGSVFHMDAASGPAGAFAAMMALRRREQTGVGELVELAQIENMCQHIGELFVDAARTGRVHGTLGNRHAWRAPQGVYPSLPADPPTHGRFGDATSDRWVAISVGNDAEWAALASVLGRPDLAGLDAAARQGGHDELDEVIGAWTAVRTAQEAFEACVRIGVAAAPVATESDCYANPQLLARGFFQTNGNDELGTHTYAGHVWRWDGPPLRWGPLPTMGGDNEAVYRGLYGLSQDEYAALAADGHLSGDYLAPDGTSL